jgi:hypothetical protein
MSAPSCRLAALSLLLAWGDSPYQPSPEALIGEFSGTAGAGFETYNLFLAVDQVGDSVRGLWSLSFPATCPTHDGPFAASPVRPSVCPPVLLSARPPAP